MATASHVSGSGVTSDEEGRQNKWGRTFLGLLDAEAPIWWAGRVR
jgi:hypothetical protein